MDGVGRLEDDSLGSNGTRTVTANLLGHMGSETRGLMMGIFFLTPVRTAAMLLIPSRSSLPVPGWACWW